MKKRYIGLCVLFLFPLWFFTNTKTVKHTFFIQAYPNSQALNTLITMVTLRIDEIIKEELGLDKDYNMTFFLPKERQRLTLYYVADMNEKDESLLFNALENMLAEKKIVAPKHVTILSQIQIFGDLHDELVIMINDSHGELAQIHQIIKKMLHDINNTYKSKYSRDLYAIAKSEQHTYVPHIGLGRIRINAIKEHIQDAQKIDIIVSALRERIKEEVLKIAHTILMPNEQLFFDKIGIFDLQKRNYKEYNL